MDHPWILAVSMVISTPFVWFTLISFSRELMETDFKDGGWLLLAGPRSLSAADWSLVRLPMFLLVCSVHVSLVYNVAVWFLV
jgi:hypothetical protein